MLLASTISNIVISDDNFCSCCINSTEILKDFDLSTYDKLSVMTDSDNILIFVDINIDQQDVAAYAQSSQKVYDYTLSQLEKEKIFKEVLKFVE